MLVFEYDEYRKFLTDYIRSQPKGGYGEASRIAKALNISPAIVTLVLANQKSFTLEQAQDLCTYLGFSELEQEYLLALVGLDRAGSDTLRRTFLRQIAKLKSEANRLDKRIPPTAIMSDESKAIFYSHWYYSAIRILTSIKSSQSLDAISEHLKLSKSTVKRVLDFLTSQNLCIEENGTYRMGPQSTHVGADSPFVMRHHANWRAIALQHTDHIQPEELFFSSPVSIAKRDFPLVKKILMNAIEDCFKVIDPSECEEAACLNIDWFRY